MTNLQLLKLNNCEGVSDESLVHLSCLTALTSLSLVATAVRGEALAHLSPCSRLQEALLGPRLSNKGFRALAHAVPQLRVLKLVDCAELTKLKVRLSLAGFKLSDVI